MRPEAVVNLNGSIEAVNLLEDFKLSFEEEVPDKATVKAVGVNAELNRELEQKLVYLDGICRTLGGVAEKLSGHYEELFAGHKEEIAKLSVEIARRVLSQKVEDGDYKIELIVSEALENAPAKQNVVVYLSSADLEPCRKAFAEKAGGASDIEFEADSSLGPAECRIETATGSVESLIESHLEQISKALVAAG